MTVQYKGKVLKLKVNQSKKINNLPNCSSGSLTYLNYFCYSFTCQNSIVRNKYWSVFDCGIQRDKNLNLK